MKMCIILGFITLICLFEITYSCGKPIQDEVRSFLELKIISFVFDFKIQYYTGRSTRSRPRTGNLSLIDIVDPAGQWGFNETLLVWLSLGTPPKHSEALGACKWTLLSLKPSKRVLWGGEGCWPINFSVTPILAFGFRGLDLGLGLDSSRFP